MRKTIALALFFTIATFGSISSATADWDRVLNRPRAARNGLSPGLMIDRGKESGNFTPGFNLRLRAIDFTPLELEGGIFINKGLYLKLNSYKLYISDRFFLHFIDFGLMKWQTGATAFNNRAEARKFDIIIGSGAEARLWRNLTLTLDLGWYLPNPIDILTRAKQDINHAFDQPAGVLPPNQQEAEQKVKAAIGHVGDVYLNALKDVHLAVGLRWYF